VAADEADIVAQRQQFFLDVADKAGAVAIIEIGAAHAAAEDDVADEGESLGFFDEDDVAGRMAGTVQDIEA
jgi:hypothetical protein